jgi:hypothetical protein
MIKTMWPGNSSDLNIIKPAWFHLKKVTTREKELSSCAEAERAWKKAWNELEQECIDTWCMKIRERIEKLGDLKKGNEYGG